MLRSSLKRLERVKMADIQLRYMTVSLDLTPSGINVAAWMSVAKFWRDERLAYPHTYTYMGDRCTWLIHSNTELTPKVIQAVGETGDRICKEQNAINANRKVSNR